MTFETIRNFAQEVMENTFSDDYFLMKMNEIRDEIDSERNFEYGTTSQNYSMSTSGQSLPSDFGTELKVVIGDDYSVYNKVQFEDWDIYKQGGFVYTIDYKNELIYFGEGNTGTATLYYNIQPVDYALMTESPSLPVRFHRLYSYKFISDYWIGEDIDEVNKSKGQLYTSKYSRLLGNMKNQDAWRKANSTRSGGYTSDNVYIGNGIIPPR